MNKIKVAHILHSVGGVDVHLRLILSALDPNKTSSFIIHGNEDTSIPFHDRNNVIVKEYKTPIKRNISPYSDFKSFLKVISILRKERPDVIHAHSAKGGIIGRAASLFYPIKVLYTPHAFSYLSTSNKIKRKIYLSIERIFKNFNSILLACSISEQKRGVEEVGYQNDKTLVFNNSIYPIIEVEESIKIKKLPEKYICAVGRPSYQKNIEMMVNVIKALSIKIPNIHLVIMGVGEYSPNKEKVKKMIKAYGLDQNITLIPWTSREQIFSIVNKSNLYISTSRYEGLPYSVIEALALSKACVVTDCDGNVDLVKESYNGYVVKKNEVETMANRIFVLLTNNKLRKEFETNSYLFFNENFNIENNIEKLEKIYLDFHKK